MHHRVRTAAGIAGTLIVAACADTSAPPAAVEAVDVPLSSLSDDSEPIPGRYIVVFRDDVADAKGKADAKVKKAKGKLKHAYASTIKGFAAELSDAAVAELRDDPDVAYIEQDQVVRVSSTQTGATWGIDRSDQRARPLSGTYSYTNTGSGVTAYIIDTGIRFAHNEFGGRAVTGYDAVDGGAADDCNGHGTHVAGTVGGATYGIAKGVTLVGVRVLDCGGSGSWSGVIAGMDWVAANRSGPSVANMSLGGGASTAVDDAARRMIAAGVATGIAAGNGNFVGKAQDACRYSPARVAEAMTIGSTTSTDAKSSFSNYGNCVDWFAPGSSITSAWHTSNTATNTISGTSMATPHVVGVAALYLQSNPAATPQQVRDGLYANTTKSVVTSAKTVNNHLLFTNY